MQRFGDRLGRLFRHVMAAGNCVSLAIGRPLGPQAQQRALQGPPLSSVIHEVAAPTSRAAAVRNAEMTPILRARSAACFAVSFAWLRRAKASSIRFSASGWAMLIRAAIRLAT